MKKAMVLCLSVVLFGWIAEAQSRHSHSTNVSSDDRSSSDDCSERLRVSSSDFGSVFRDESTATVPNHPLTIRSERNGGIQVTTWDSPEFSIKLCKQIASDNVGDAHKALEQTKLQINGDDISVTSPESSEDYVLGTLLLIKAPRNAKVSLSANNGGISLRKFAGTAQARTTNGGISLNQSTGTLSVEAQNGGISIKDCSGDVSANVQNGGLSITLPEKWDGKGMEAHTQNGGMSISVPRNFSTLLEVTGSEHVPISCRGDICDLAQRTWDNGHKMFRLGNAGPVVRLSTVNGGITIKDRRADL